MFSVLRLVAASWVVLTTVTGFAQAQSKEAATGYPWYSVDAKNNVTIHLYVFWSSTCPHCPPAVEFARDLQKRRSWAKVTLFEISENEGNRALYWKMAGNLNKPVGPTPVFVYCRYMHNGYHSFDHTGKHIEADMTRWHEFLTKHYQKEKPKSPSAMSIATAVFALVGDDPPMPPELPPDLPPDLPPAGETITAPVWGEVDVESLSLPAFTIVIAACDAFNPCAFFILLLLLSLMVHHHSRLRMAFIGGVFVAASGVMYFLFMAAWLNVFVLVGHMRIITLVAGALAVVAALINVKDFFWFKQGPSLSIPDSARPSLLRRMNHLLVTSRPIALVTGTVALAFAANLYELLCTAGFPMVYTRVLTLRELSPTTYYLYLAAYNVIYVLPMALIVAGFVFTLGSYKLSEYQGRVMKLLSGLMMLGLGIVIMIWPEWLTSVSAAVILLALAGAGTAAVALLDRWRGQRSKESPGRVSTDEPVSV